MVTVAPSAKETEGNRRLQSRGPLGGGCSKRPNMNRTIANTISETDNNPEAVADFKSRFPRPRVAYGNAARPQNHGKKMVSPNIAPQPKACHTLQKCPDNQVNWLSRIANDNFNDSQRRDAAFGSSGIMLSQVNENHKQPNINASVKANSNIPE